MTATSVKDVGSVMNLGVAQGAPAAKTGGEKFQNVWNTQTGKGKTSEQQGADNLPREASRAGRTEKPGKDLRAADRSNVRADEGKEAEPVKAKGRAADEMSEEDLEAAMEVLETAAAELISQIADTFQMPVEEVQELMQELDIQPADLLQPENLSNLLLKAGGAEDTMNLVTDEQLYTDFRTLMEQGQTVLEQTAEKLQMTPEQVVSLTAETETDIAEDAPEIAAQDETAAEESGKAKAEPAGGNIAEPAAEKIPAIRAESPKAETAEEPERSDLKTDRDADAQIGEAEAEESVQPQTAKEQTADNSSDDRRGSRREGQEHGRMEGNLVLETIRSEQFQPQAEAVQQTVSVWDSDTQNLMRQIMDYMRIQVRPDVSNLEMQLHPASLGTLQIQVASKGGVLTANFVTQNEAVKAALESQMVQLKESFEQQGVRVEAIEVTVQTHQFEENLEQGRGRQPQESGDRRGRTRRINLNELGGSAGAEEMDEAEQLAAAMMAADGNTVDYTA